MKIFTTELRRKADDFTINNEPISSLDLMERAAVKCTEKIIELYPEIKQVDILAGTGNNGGDGLAVARLLSERNISVKVLIIQISKQFSDDFKINLKRLTNQNKAQVEYINEDHDLPEFDINTLIIDAVLGSGLTRKISGFLDALIKKINTIENEIVSLDIPTGLFADENFVSDQSIIKATHTITFQYPPLSFMFPENEVYVGCFHVVDIGIHKTYIKETYSDYFLTEPSDIKIKKRMKFSHKGNYGHVLIVAGSFGKAGASVLSVKAAHRTGAGLVTAAVPKCNYQILQILSPETMLQIDTSEEFITELKNLSLFNSVAIGPGIGFNNLTKEFLLNLMKNYNKPIVIDADALTILSENNELYEFIPKNSILTPHPKEFERLTGKTQNNFKRLQEQIKFSKKYHVYVILKGAFSSLSTPEAKVFFNTTGNPGMATAGSGDVLTGIIAGFLAQNYTPFESALYGMYIHGLSGDIAAIKKGQYSLIASDIIKYLPDAFKQTPEFNVNMENK